MFRNRKAVENAAVAGCMRTLFRRLNRCADPAEVARTYGRLMWDADSETLMKEKKLSRSRFYVGLATEASNSFESITKRAVLVTDTLLLSHDWTGEYHELGDQPNSERKRALNYASMGSTGGAAMMESYNKDHTTTMYGMYCPSLEQLGCWILDAEALLKAGLAWYLPSYALSTFRVDNYERQPPVGVPAQVRAIDYLIRDGRAIDASGAEPIKSQLVRPVLQMELPFIEGVGLRDFSKITVEEFDSYAAFRGFLRLRFMEMDQAMNSTQSDRDLLKLGQQIENEVRSVHSQIKKAKRNRAIAAAGTAVGCVTAILVAVYGPAMDAVITALGTSSPGVWKMINVANDIRGLHDDRWYYVWALGEAHKS
jgi:hypothetical protein